MAAVTPKRLAALREEGRGTTKPDSAAGCILGTFFRDPGKRSAERFLEQVQTLFGWFA